jgi:hypothetical protein
MKTLLSNMQFSDKQYTAAISCASAGNNTLIAAPSAGRITVDHIHAIPEAATTITLKSGSTALTGVENYDPQQAFTLESTDSESSQEGIFTCGFKEALVLTLGSAVNVRGYVKYRILDSY